MAFGLIFALMTAFVAVVIVSAANARNYAAGTHSSCLQRVPGSSGGVADLEAGNRVLKLAHTGVDKAGRLRLTSTTVSDQLQLLADLTLAGSPLDAASRAYALGLMEHVGAHQRWGVLAAAGEGTNYAGRGGWLADPRRGVADRHGSGRPKPP